MTINRISNFLEDNVLQALRKKFEDAKGTPSFEVNNMGRWGAGLEFGSYSPVLILPLEDYRQYFLDKYCTMFPVFKDFETRDIENIICLSIFYNFFDAQN